MNTDLSEEEMCSAPFGDAEPAPQAAVTPVPEPAPQVVFVELAALVAKKKPPRHSPRDYE
jgi:hypothetical protein